MSNKVTNPNAKSNSGFLWGMVVLLVIVAAVIGYIVISNQGAKTSYLSDRETEEFNATVTYKDNVVTLAAAEPAADAKEVELYEDFSCPHCAELAVATDAQMKQEIEAGNLIVNIRPLNFLDQGNTEGHSTLAVATTTKLAESGDASAYWNLRKVLLEDQQKIARKWSIEDFANAAGELGAEGAAVDSMKAATAEDGASTGQANFDDLEAKTGEVSSPRVLVDGKDVEGSIDQWIDTVLEA